MKIKEIIPIFIQFLRDNNCLLEYMINRNLHPFSFSEAPKIPLLKSWLAVKSPYNFMSDAFHWKKTIEGHEYWEVLASSWENYIYEIITKNSPKK